MDSGKSEGFRSGETNNTKGALLNKSTVYFDFTDLEKSFDKLVSIWEIPQEREVKNKVINAIHR